MPADQDPDEAVLAELRAYFARVDPVPPLVREAARAAIGWRRLDADLASLLADSALEEEALAYARGTSAAVRSVSFGAGELTIDVEIHLDGERRLLLGQLVPALAARIEIQMTDGAGAVARAESDGLGRFRAQLDAGGAIRLRILPRDSSLAPSIETSWITV